jgi:hypothetical protein
LVDPTIYERNETPNKSLAGTTFYTHGVRKKHFFIFLTSENTMALRKSKPNVPHSSKARTDESPSEKNDFAFQLLENAEDSFRHGIEHFLEGSDPSNLKQAILLVFHALELFLKARLAKEHRTLIFVKPELADTANARTVNLEGAIQRLEVANLKLDLDSKKHIEHIQNLRNRLEHYEYEGNHEKTGNLLAVIIKILEKFLTTHLDIHWASFLHQDVLIEIEKLVLSHEDRRERSSDRANKAADCSCDPKEYCECVTYCPECSIEAVPRIDRNSTTTDLTRCYSCGEEYFLESCARCDQPILSTKRWDPEMSPHFCDDCYADRYSD